MAKESKRIKLPATSELALLIKDAIRAGESLLVDTGDSVYSLTVGTANTTTTQTEDEVARSKEGILKSAGGWKGLIDAEDFKKYIYERRRTSSRPPVRL